MDEQRRGLIFGAAAYGLWGLFPLYWPLLKPAGALEILSHRIVWSLLAVIALLAWQRAFDWLPAVGVRRVLLLAVAAIAIAVNWGTYIYGVNADQVVETSLGYFINPLITVLFGVVILRERLRPTQWAALGCGALAVVVLTVDYGRPPWIALTLALSFGIYGLLKKQASVDTVQSLTIETSVLSLPALVYLAYLGASGGSHFTGHGADHIALLVCSGIVTAVPLLLFGASTNRVPLSTIGLLQYLAPVLQFFIGVVVEHEHMPASRFIGFGLVWLALVVLSADAVRASRRRRGAVPEPVAA